MKNRTAYLMTVLIAFTFTAYGHGDEKHEKPQKVSGAMMHEEGMDTTHHEGMEDMHDERAAQLEQRAMDRDFETIRAAVQGSETFIVVKALAVAVAIIGLAAVYLPRKGKRSV